MKGLKQTLRKVVALMTGLSLLCFFSSPMVTEAATPDPLTYTYNYTGSSQTFTAPATGTYTIEIKGGQGGSTSSHSGGKGGYVKATVSLNLGDTVTIHVGGQGSTSGTGAGGSGTITNGGGATSVWIKDSVTAAMVAGGGGGATNYYDGLDAGDTSDPLSIWRGGSVGVGIPTTPGLGTGGSITIIPTASVLSGESVASGSKGAGGGGGATAGAKGIEDLTVHTHLAKPTELSASAANDCWAPVYHSHIGSSSVSGGCYTTPVNHTHSSSCYNKVTGTWQSYEETIICRYGETVAMVDGCGEQRSATNWKCSRCGAKLYTLVIDHNTHYVGGGGSAPANPTHVCSQTLNCSKAGTVDHYDLSCGKTTSTIEDWQLDCGAYEYGGVYYDVFHIRQAQGGGNSYDSAVCSNVTVTTGANTGNGSCTITVDTVPSSVCYGETQVNNFYYGNAEVKCLYYNGKIVYKK